MLLSLNRKEFSMTRLQSLRRTALATVLSGMLGFGGSAAADVYTELPSLNLDLAQELAMATVQSCRDDGHQVSAVVVDRSGNDRVVMRDDRAAPQTISIAGDKARASVMSGLDSGDFVANREDIRDEMNNVDGILMLDGAILIEAAGRMLGAVGVSGAPGGDLDRACAEEGMEAIREELDFAM
ncbi:MULTISPECIES: heme-binding protein [unclassified Thioalkalivibrio]